MISRFGGHQRGWVSGAGFPGNKSQQKVPGRRRQMLNVDRWLTSGQTRFAHVIGTTWIQAMAGSQQLEKSFEGMVVQNPNQVRSYDKQEIIDRTLHSSSNHEEPGGSCEALAHHAR